jgi:glycosyltransferase involved in cell wall biosynthesis
MARTRLLCITHSMVRGGAPTSLDLLVRSLDPSRYECIIACIYPTPEILAFHEAAGVQVVPAPNIMDLPHTTGGWLRPWNPRQVLRLLRIGLGWRHSVRAAEELIEEVQPDIVYLNSLILPTAALAARRSGTKLVWQVRESVASGLFGVRRRWYERLLRTIPDAVIFLSQSDAQMFGLQNPNWWVIPDQSEFPEEIPVRDTTIAARRQIGLPETARVVLFLGGLSEIKGIFPLMRAVPLVRMEVPDAVFLIGGVHPHPSSSRFQLKARILALSGRKTSVAEAEEAIRRAGDGVVVAPFVDHPGTYLHAADILVFPSVVPHFARPVIEAFAYGVPVVASNIGGPDELVSDENTGLLTEPGNVTDLAAVLIRALTDRQLSRSLAERAFLEGKERFDLRVGTAQIDRLFREVLATRGQRADARRGT